MIPSPSELMIERTMLGPIGSQPIPARWPSRPSYLGLLSSPANSQIWNWHLGVESLANDPDPKLRRRARRAVAEYRRTGRIIEA